MTLGIMALDMRKLRRLPKSLYIPIQMPQPLVQIRIPGPDVADIAFEMLHIHRIEAHNRCEQADVGFGDVVAGEEVWCCGVSKVLLEAVE